MDILCSRNKEVKKNTGGFTLVKSLVFLIALVMLTSLAWADSNGVWHEAEDVRGTVFGADEGYPNYIFNSTVNFKKELKYNGAELDALYINKGETGDSLQDNTVDNSEIQNSGSFTFGGITTNGNLDMNNNNIELAKNIYANVFYDRDNTAYAVEPAAGSNMNILRVYGKLNMNGNNINNIGKINNVDSTDNVSNLNSDMVDGKDWSDIQSYVDNKVGGISSSYLPDDPATSNVNMNGNKINNVGTPSNGDDVATKEYVDNSVKSNNWNLLITGTEWTEEARTTITSSGVSFRTDSNFNNQRIDFGNFNWPEETPNELLFFVKNDGDDFCVGGNGTNNLDGEKGENAKCTDYKYQGTSLTKGTAIQGDWIQLYINNNLQVGCSGLLGRTPKSGYPGKYGTCFNVYCTYDVGSSLNSLKIETADWSDNYGEWEWEIWYR